MLSHAKPLKGKLIHFPDGRRTYLPYGTKKEEVAYCIQRKELNKVLLGIAENNNIGVYFGYGFSSADLEDNKFIFQN